MGAGAELRAILRAGFNVLVHCKGGLGRAGTIASRLLIELGIDPHAAVAAVRAPRLGAIETPAQFAYVRSLSALDQPQPDTALAASRDRALGALLGLAVGDALGTTLDFAAGQWTDDTAITLVLA